jgi:hypothetical protein
MISRKIFSGLVILAMVLGFAAAPSFAGDPDRIGTAAGVQVQVPVGARDMALVGSNIAYTSGLDAIYWNPAGLARMENTAAAQFSYMSIFNDIGVNYLAAAYGNEDLGTFGFSIKSFSFGDIPFTTVEDMDGTSGRTFSPTFVTLGFTYSRLLTEAVNVGFTLKLINESIDRAAANAFAFDIGLQYTNLGSIDGLSFAVALKNIGSNLQYAGSGLGSNYQNTSGREDFLTRETASNQLPASIEIGFGYKAMLAERNSVTIAGDFISNNFENDAAKVGLEYSFDDFLFARGGYNIGMGVDKDAQLYDFALGAGIQYPLGDVNFRFDYAYRNSQYFDGENIFTVSLGF